MRVEAGNERILFLAKIRWLGGEEERSFAPLRMTGRSQDDEEIRAVESGEKQSPWCCRPRD
jgi:hypothetical protein